MSSIVALQGPQGFVISTDNVVFNTAKDASGKVDWKIKGVTHKLFQISDDILAAAVGSWNSYFPIFNHVAAMKEPKENLLEELRTHGVKTTPDTHMYIFHREKTGIILDVIEGGQVKPAFPGVVMYPEPLLNSIFLSMYENEYAKKVRNSGMFGIASLAHAYNAFALSLCGDIAAPFDTILFTMDGIFNFSGGVTRLPVANFM